MNPMRDASQNQSNFEACSPAAGTLMPSLAKRRHVSLAAPSIL